MLTDSEQFEMEDIAVIVGNLGNWSQRDLESSWLIERWRELNAKQQKIDGFVLGPLPGSTLVC